MHMIMTVRIDSGERLAPNKDVQVYISECTLSNHTHSFNCKLQAAQTYFVHKIATFTTVAMSGIKGCFKLVF